MSGAVQTIGPVVFDYKWWATKYPDLAEWVSPGMAEEIFYLATYYCANPGGMTPAACDLWLVFGLAGIPMPSSVIQDIPKRQRMIGLLMVHIAKLVAPIGGDPPSGLVGRITNASEGSVSVAVEFPQNPSEAWYNQTTWGAMFLQATKQYRMAEYFPGPGAAFNRWPFGRFMGFALLLMMATPAFAHDMSEPFADWYQSLTVPGTGTQGGGISPHSCCSGGKGERDEDCKNVETRTTRDADGSVHIEAFASSKLFPDSDRSPWYGHAPNDWVRVPDAAIIHGKNNPTGQAVGCWFGGHWRCFVEGTLT